MTELADGNSGVTERQELEQFMEMDQMLKGQVVVITGASSGLGKAIALEAAQRQATLILLARNLDRLNEVAAEARIISGQEAYVIECDMTRPADIDAAFAKLQQVVDHVDVLVNAAGFGDFSEFVAESPEVVSSMFETNVLGLMYLTRLVAREMMEQMNGQVINIGSMAGKVPTVKSAAYSATKAAVIGFSNVLRLELKPFNVSVMTVNPGPIYTNFFNIADKTGEYVENVKWLMMDPDDVALKIVDQFGTKKRELNLPFVLAVAAKLYSIFPTIGDYLSLKFASEK